MTRVKQSTYSDAQNSLFNQCNCLVEYDTSILLESNVERQDEGRQSLQHRVQMNIVVSSLEHELNHRRDQCLHVARSVQRTAHCLSQGTNCVPEDKFVFDLMNGTCQQRRFKCEECYVLGSCWQLERRC
jgi:nicotinamide riboside kinase